MTKPYTSAHLACTSGLIRPRLSLRDGSTLSIQASPGHYSSPRASEGPYADSGDIDGDVYGYVPIDVVDQEIERRGGVAGTK